MMNSRIKNIESALSYLTNIAQMQTAHVQSYFLNSENILSIQNSILSLQKEFSCLKKQVIDLQSQQKDQQLNLLKEKNAEFINLQNKLSESEKIISNARLENADLKRSISMQEAQNALLIAENLSLKNKKNSENDDLTRKSTFRKEVEDELRNAQKTNYELQNTIKKLKHDLEQTKAVSFKYKDLNDPEKATQNIDRINSEIDEEKNLSRSSQFTISELKYQLSQTEETLNKTIEKQAREINQLTNLLKKLSSKFERTINSKGRMFDDKIISLNKCLLEIKAKLMFRDNLKKENSILSNKIEIANQLLEFAMQAMANLVGVSDENIPCSYDVLENSEMLSIYVSDLQAKVVEKSITEAEIKPKASRKQQLNTTLDTMNDLMNIMTEQMQNEHEILMSQISDDKKLPSFRKTVMNQLSYNGK